MNLNLSSCARGPTYSRKSSPLAFFAGLPPLAVLAATLVFLAALAAGFADFAVLATLVVFAALAAGLAVLVAAFLAAAGVMVLTFAAFAGLAPAALAFRRSTRVVRRALARLSCVVCLRKA